MAPISGAASIVAIKLVPQSEQRSQTYVAPLLVRFHFSVLPEVIFTSLAATIVEMPNAEPVRVWQSVQ